MDKSYEFKRKSLYWHSVLKSDSDSLNPCYSDDSVVDRYYLISSILFNRLICLESLLSPYTIFNDEQTIKTNSYGILSLPKNVNLNNFIRSKRVLFNKIGIESIVHDTKVIGELINQMEGSLNASIHTNNISESERKHKEGINSCLNYLFQIVKDDVQTYQRQKLKFETSLNNNLKIMSENLSEVRNLDSSKNVDSIPNSYLSNFISSENASQTQYIHLDQPMSKSNSVKSGYSSPDRNIPNHSMSSNNRQRVMFGNDSKFVPNVTNMSNLGSLKFNKGTYNISTNYIDSSEMDNQQVADTLVQQHSRTVNSINDQIKANELLAINSVQERLTEISSMFVKLTGTVEQQNELHQIINANVQESLSNIEKTQDTLKKTSKEDLPLYHRILCMALVGLSLFLLFIDYLKSTKGSYLF